MFRLDELFNDRKGSLQAVSFAAALRARLATIVPQHAPDQKWCKIARFTDNKATFDSLFEDYNAALIDSYVLAEGPDQKIPSSIDRFYSNTLLNRDFPVRIFFAAGNPTPPKGNGFYNYFSNGINSFSFEPLSVIRLLCADVNNTPERTAALERLFANKKFHLSFHIFKHHETCALAIHLNNWPDYGMAQLAEGDILFLQLLANLRFPMLLNCAAGLGRSVTVLATLLAFLQQLYLAESSNEVIEKFAALVARIRQYKPGAFPHFSQCLLALQWVSEMGASYRTHQHLLAVQTEFNEELFSERLATLYQTSQRARSRLCSTMDFADLSDEYDSGSVSDEERATSTTHQPDHTKRLIVSNPTDSYYTMFPSSSINRTGTPPVATTTTDLTASNSSQRSCGLTASQENLGSDCSSPSPAPVVRA